MGRAAAAVTVPLRVQVDGGGEPTRLTSTVVSVLVRLDRRWRSA